MIRLAASWNEGTASRVTVSPYWVPDVEVRPVIHLEGSKQGEAY